MCRRDSNSNTRPQLAPVDRFPAILPHATQLHGEMSAVRTIVVGCGEPKKSMGWFHLQQLSVNPKAELLAVVEPW